MLSTYTDLLPGSHVYILRSLFSMFKISTWVLCMVVLNTCWYVLWKSHMFVGLRGLDPCSMLIRQTNPYSTGPFSINSRTMDRSLTWSSMGDAGTKFPHLDMVVMSSHFLYPCLYVGGLALRLVRQTLYSSLQYLHEIWSTFVQP